jgi:hypothetical protein
MWLSWPTHTKGKSPKLQSPWDGPYRVITQINDVVYRIKLNPRLRMMVVHLDGRYLIRELLGASNLKEGATGTVGE